MGFSPVVFGMIATCDPWVFIEAQRYGYIRYRCLSTGRRWEVHGTCAWTDPATDGPCQQGQDSWPIGAPEGRLDCPVTPELDCSLCVGDGHLSFTELPSMQDLGEMLPLAAASRAHDLATSGVIRVVVTSDVDDPVAARAIRAEGLSPSVARVDGDDHALGRLVTDLWRAGEAFCLLRGDVVPWPDAMAGLFLCPDAWCGHQSGPGDDPLACVKFGTSLLAAMSPDWSSTYRADLGRTVAAEIGERLRRRGYHRHMPDMAVT